MAAIELYSTPLFSDANLKAYYRLEDVTDSKNDYDLTNYGTTTFGSAKFNNGAECDSTSKRLQVASNLGTAGNGDLSISFWIKLTSEVAFSDVRYSLVSIYSTTGADRFLSFNYEYNGGTRRLAVTASGTFTYYEIALGTDNWYHLVVTRSSGGNVIVYKNGDSVATGSAGSSAGGGNQFGISTGSSSGAKALFDDVAVFNKVLSTTEISNLYNGNWSTLKSVNGLANASIKSKNGLAIASVKSINGLS